MVSDAAPSVRNAKQREMWGALQEKWAWFVQGHATLRVLDLQKLFEHITCNQEMNHRA